MPQPKITLVMRVAGIWRCARDTAAPSWLPAQRIAKDGVLRIGFMRHARVWDYA